MTTDLTVITSMLPASWATCPIYLKGVTMPNGGIACGKSPLGRAHHENLAPAASALYIEQHPDTYGAIGVFTGARSQGLVIVDIDANLPVLHDKWGADLDTAPHVTSPKPNAGKYLFRVPQEHWGTVAGLSLAQTGEGYEVLWGRQGLVGGAYHSGGQYELHGDLNALPEAPGWLLARMQKAYQDSQSTETAKKLVDSRYSRRTREEKVAIATACLSVIPAPGRGSEDLWWRIGAMIHAELPGDEGLNLWREWSLKDEEYIDDWANGNDPCLSRWEAGFRGGGLGFGSLIKLADHHDPERARFQRDDLARVVEETEAAVQRIETSVLSFEEAMSRVAEAMELADPGKRNFTLNQIAAQAGYRDQSKLEQVYVDHIGFKEHAGEMSLAALKERKEQRTYLIPDVLPTPAVVLLYGSGGDGKSMCAWSIAKHVVEGIPFVVRGRPLPVQAGPVLFLNGDQPLDDLLEQLEEADYPLDDRTTLRNDWSLQYYAQFVDLMKRVKPALVVIDSLIGCSGGKAFDENKSDFAMPLYWLTRNNGVLWPAATILVIHHANKTGGFRGTSAIRDAVTETWKLSKPEPGRSTLQPHQRLITIEKSRSGRSGTNLLMQMENDLSFSVTDFVPEQDESDTSPASVTGRLLARLRVVYPRTLTRTELNADPQVGGNVGGIRKALQRLVKRGLVVTVEVPTPRGGKPTHTYQAVLSRSTPLSRAHGEREESVPPDQIPCAGTEEQWDTAPISGDVSHSSDVGADGMGHTAADLGVCPIANPSGGAGSAPVGTPDTYPRARDERSEQELERLIDSSFGHWERLS